MTSTHRLLRGLAAACAMCWAVGGAAQTCGSHRIPDAAYGWVVSDLGATSFQLDPSTVILRTRYVEANAPLSVEVVFAGGDRRFTDAVVAEARKVQPACAFAPVPAEAIETYRVGVVYKRLDLRGREAEPRLKEELELADVVRTIKLTPATAVHFDLREMKCPFAVVFAPYQPYLPNLVREVADEEPKRAAFLEWLRSVTLSIPARMMTTAIGRESLLYVPCAVLDLR